MARGLVEIKVDLTPITEALRAMRESISRTSKQLEHFRQRYMVAMGQTDEALAVAAFINDGGDIVEILAIEEMFEVTHGE